MNNSPDFISYVIVLLIAKVSLMMSVKNLEGGKLSLSHSYALNFTFAFINLNSDASRLRRHFSAGESRDANGVNGRPDKKSYSESYQFHRALFYDPARSYTALL